MRQAAALVVVLVVALVVSRRCRCAPRLHVAHCPLAIFPLATGAADPRLPRKRAVPPLRPVHGTARDDSARRHRRLRRGRVPVTDTGGCPEAHDVRHARPGGRPHCRAPGEWRSSPLASVQRTAASSPLAHACAAPRSLPALERPPPAVPLHACPCPFPALAADVDRFCHWHDHVRGRGRGCSGRRRGAIGQGHRRRRGRGRDVADGVDPRVRLGAGEDRLNALPVCPLPVVVAHLAPPVE